MGNLMTFPTPHAESDFLRFFVYLEAIAMRSTLKHGASSHALDFPIALWQY